MSFPLTTITDYAMLTISNQISIELLLWSHIAPSVFGLIFSFFIYQQTKKTSALYLLIISILFTIWSYMALVSWFGLAHQIMFSWAIMDIFSICFNVLVLWFVYAFITGKDVPLIPKILSSMAVIPVLAYTALSLNINSYYSPEGLADEANLVLFYVSAVEIILILAIIFLGVYTYRQTTDVKIKKRALYGTIGALIFLFFMTIFRLVVSLLIYFDLGGYDVYNTEIYSRLGLPFMTAFLAYLIAKYQAFDLKLTKSIGLILLLMILLFASIFI